MPVPIGACGNFWLWLHTTALSRLAPAPERPTMVSGVDVTLSRRLIEGGCSIQVDPRIAVMSSWRATADWALEPAAVPAASLPAEVTP